MTTRHTFKLTATTEIALAVKGEHRAIRRRAEVLLKELEDSGCVIRTEAQGVTRWRLAGPHPAFTEDLVAETREYLNGSQARYETLMVSPTVCMLLAASMRKPHHLPLVLAMSTEQ